MLHFHNSWPSPLYICSIFAFPLVGLCNRGCSFWGCVFCSLRIVYVIGCKNMLSFNLQIQRFLNREPESSCVCQCIVDRNKQRAGLDWQEGVTLQQSSRKMESSSWFVGVVCCYYTQVIFFALIVTDLLLFPKAVVYLTQDVTFRLSYYFYKCRFLHVF